MAPPELRALVARIRRAQGQLSGIATMLEEGRSCDEIVQQLSAVKKALDRTGFVMLESAVRGCLTDPESGETDVEAVRRLFLSLS
ncbi:MAG: metal-sensitive transcriptional regulator [Micropruina sp.]|nr:MAG: metal-sensitive transcriptional regulator [Micropruina sp.]